MNYHIRQLKSQKIVVSSVNYISPIRELAVLTQELKIKHYSGEVVFDLLCVNGNNPNRFISIRFDGDLFDRSSTSCISNPEIELIKSQTSFYKKHSKFISNSVLSQDERLNYTVYA